MSPSFNNAITYVPTCICTYVGIMYVVHFHYTANPMRALSFPVQSVNCCCQHLVLHRL